ncbi:MAG: ester cyclase [Deinococcus sp.]
MTHVDSAAVDRRLMDAFNAGEWEGVRAIAAPDMVYEEPPTQRRTQGVEDYIRLCQGWREAFPDCTGDIRRSMTSGDTMVQEVSWEGTHTGPLQTPGGNIPATGKHFRVEAVIWSLLEGDRFMEIRHHLDIFSMFQQLGLIPTAEPAGA